MRAWEEAEEIPSPTWQSVTWPISARRIAPSFLKATLERKPLGGKPKHSQTQLKGYVTLRAVATGQANQATA